jgi:cytochrome c oxidase subunit II
VTTAYQSALAPAGPQAASIEWLFWFFTAVCGLVFAAVLAALLMAVVRGYRRPGEAAVSRPDPRSERRLTRAVVGATALTILLLFTPLIGSYATDRDLLRLAGREELTIQVIGHQWWWEVRYDDGQPHRRLTTANEIHIPVGKVVRVRLTSPDVIHSLWIPNLHGKLDLVPGQENALELMADRPGVYRGQCAEFCGFQHAHMALLVVAEPEAAFRAWYEGQLAPAAEPSTESERQGREVFLNGSCMMCHRIRGTSAGATMGPDLTHLKSRQTIAAGTLPNAPGDLAAWVADPQAIKPGVRMPLTRLSPPDSAALLSYLESLR